MDSIHTQVSLAAIGALLVSTALHPLVCPLNAPRVPTQQVQQVHALIAQIDTRAPLQR